MGLKSTDDELMQGTGVHLDSEGDMTGLHTVVTDILCFANLSTPPSSASDTGTVGEVRVTTTYLYVCTATDTWKRVALSTW